MMEPSTGYECNIPFENGFLGEMLLQHGYNSYAVGKWHLTPAEQMSAAGLRPVAHRSSPWHGRLGAT